MTMGCSHGTFLKAGHQFRLPLRSSIHSLFLVTAWDQEVESLILSSGGHCRAGKMTETDVSTTGGAKQEGGPVRPQLPLKSGGSSLFQAITPALTMSARPPSEIKCHSEFK